jgi:nitrile hydratase
MGLSLLSPAMAPWPIDETRHARESLHPAQYYGSTYFEIWIRGLESILRRRGFITEADLAAGRPASPAPKPFRVIDSQAAQRMVANGTPYDRELDAPARFAVGDRVRTRNMHPTGHTRLPRYARAKHGVIETVHGGFVFPDSNAHGHGEAPQRLYTVLFQGSELWGTDSDPRLSVSVDAFESYLEPA